MSETNWKEVNWSEVYWKGRREAKRENAKVRREIRKMDADIDADKKIIEILGKIIERK